MNDRTNANALNTSKVTPASKLITPREEAYGKKRAFRKRRSTNTTKALPDKPMIAPKLVGISTSKGRMTKSGPSGRSTEPKKENGAFKHATKSTKQGDAAAKKNTAEKPKKTTKADRVLRLLKRKSGASLAELMETTGWQAHSVRGFLSGTVKKRMHLGLDSEADKQGVRRYRVMTDASSSKG